jgi:HKD family nuclease
MVSFKKFMTENMNIRELDSILESSNSSEYIASVNDSGDVVLESIENEIDEGVEFDEDEFSILL